MKNNSVKTVVAIGIGAALFFILGRFVAIPSPVPNTTISLQYGLLSFMAVLFGPLAGGLIGLIGHTLIDLSYGWGIWWSWVLATMFFGIFMGFASRTVHLQDGEFGSKGIAGFNLFQVIGHVIAWGLIAPSLDIAMYAEPASKVFLQGLVSGLSNVVTTAILGTIICAAYAGSRPKKGSLKQEA